MKKLFIKADVYNELIEKGYGKRDLSKLTRKVITDKNGHRRTVFVKNEVETTVNKKPSAAYWIQDWEGNRITSDDAKKRIKSIDDKLEYMESMKEGRTKDVVVSIDAKKRQLENYQKDLISKLKPEDRNEIEGEKKFSDKKAESEKVLESITKYLFPINDNGTRNYHFINRDGKLLLKLDSAYGGAQPVAGNVITNKDGSVTIKGYKTYGEVVADEDSDYAKRNRVLRPVTVTFTIEELQNRDSSFYNKLKAYSQGSSYNN